MVEGVRVSIGGSFLTAPIFQKDAALATGEADLTGEAAKIEESP
jgi:hypothetical protein